MKTIAIILTAILFISCEKVIELDLKNGEHLFVIEGIVQENETEHQVKISKSVNFENADGFPYIDNAVVTISDNLGNMEVLTYSEKGIYKTQNLQGVELRTYTLTVQVDGKTFSASSTIPGKVPFDSLSVDSFSFGPEPVYSITAHRTDPAGIENFYQFDLFKSGNRIPGIYIQDDQFSDGVEMLQPIYFGDEYESGDTAVVFMYSIDAPVYQYFYELSLNSGGTAGVTPVNPRSNFGKECLGYFSARTKESRTIVVP